MKQKVAQYGIAVLLFVGLFFVYRYHEVLYKFPQTVHQWRQCDGASIAMMYVHNGLNFFEPGVYNLHGNGKTVAEFPIIYYVDAILIQLLGEVNRHAIIRFVNILISFLGGFYLFKIGLLLYKRWWWSFFPAVLFSSFPIVTYYSATSVPDVPALSFLFIGIYYLFRYVQQRNKGALFAAIFFVALAGMIKSTALITYIAICAVLVIDQMRKQKTLSISSKAILFLGVPLLATFAWIYWAGNYNEANENVTFLMNIKPIWGIDRAFIDEISRRIKENWLQEYIYRPVMWMIVGMGAILLFNFKKEWQMIRLGLVMLLLGTAAYFYLFFEQFYHHDYYAIELLPLLLVAFMAFLYRIEQVSTSKIGSNLFSIVVGVMLLISVLYARSNMNKRYTVDTKYNNYNDIYLEIAPILRTHGIEYSDKVIVCSDNSPNISLYLMDQKGWTRFPYGFDEDKLKVYLKEDAKYLISTEEDLANRPYLIPYLKDTLFHYKHVLAFNL
jgi:hypothetical protein